MRVAAWAGPAATRFADRDRQGHDEEHADQRERRYVFNREALGELLPHHAAEQDPEGHSQHQTDDCDQG